MSGLRLSVGSYLAAGLGIVFGSLLSVCYQVLKQLRTGRSPRVAHVAGFKLSWFSSLSWTAGSLGGGVSPQVVTRFQNELWVFAGKDWGEVATEATGAGVLPDRGLAPL